MIRINIVNNSTIPDNYLASFAKDIEKRLESVDFEKFNIDGYSLYLIANADKDSIRYTTPLSDSKKYILFQGIPQEYAYNSSFEAKMSTIRMRIQNMAVGAELSKLENIVFVVDFERTDSNAENNDSHNGEENSKLPANKNSLIKRIFHKNDEESDSEKKRKATFVPISPKFSLDNVIMTSDMKMQIEDALSIIRNRKKIYEEWGFGEIDPQPKAILSFWGPPGTGKTMCAHGIAQSMGAKILAVNYAEIESKYAGESPKNLSAAFNAAQENNAVLFFDEADSFLGKRISNVQSGHDQSINSLRSQMLILLENFEGIVIFATNLVKNFDRAFETRILRHIKFDLPDSTARGEIYKKMIPRKLPLAQKFSNEDFDVLARSSEGFSGRDIRNSILDTLSSAARNQKTLFVLDDFLTAIKQRQEAYAKLIEEHKQENKKIAEDIKNSIIEKSKQDLNEALVGTAIYAAWADEVLDTAKENLIKELANALGVTLQTEIKLDYMPPLSRIVEFFNTKEKRFRAIDVAIRIVAIDGTITVKEKQFMVQLLDMLHAAENEKSDCLTYMYSLAKINTDWNKIINQ